MRLPRLAVVVFAAAMCLTACASEPEKTVSFGVSAAPTRTASPTPSPTPVSTATATKGVQPQGQGLPLGSASVTNGVLTVGTGSGRVTMNVGPSMRVFERTYAETGVAGVESSSNPNVKLSLFPTETAVSNTTAEQLTKIVQSRGSTSVRPVQTASLGNVKAVAVDAKTRVGHLSRVYLLRIEDGVWNLTVAAPSQKELDALLKAAQTFNFAGPQGSGGSDMVAGVGGDGRSDSQPGSDPQEERVSVLSRDGKLRGGVKGGQYNLQTPSGVISFPMPSKMTLTERDEDDRDAIGIEANGASLLFEVGDEEEYHSGEDLADEWASKEDDDASGEYLGQTKIAGLPAVAVRHITESGDFRYLYVVEFNGTYLNVMVEGEKRSAATVNMLLNTMRRAKAGR